MKNITPTGMALAKNTKWTLRITSIQAFVLSTSFQYPVIMSF